MKITPLTTWDYVSFETPDGWRVYVALGELGKEAFVGEGSVGATDLPHLGDVAEVQDLGPGGKGPVRDLLLRRTANGWVEEELPSPRERTTVILGF